MNLDRLPLLARIHHSLAVANTVLTVVSAHRVAIAVAGAIAITLLIVTLNQIYKRVTMHRQHLESLMRALWELREMKAAVNDNAIIASTDRHGLINHANDKFCAVTKYSREELLGKQHWMVHEGQHSPEFIQQVWSAIRTKHGWKGDLEIRDKEGTRHWMQTAIVPYMDKKGGDPERYILIWVDITERKQAEQLIRAMNADLEDRVSLRTQELNQANAELREQIAARRRLQEEILALTEREQLRISHDLHDDLGQQLAGLWCLTRVMEKNLVANASPEAANAARISELLENALSMTRDLARGLLPVEPEPLGLTAALQALAARAVELFHISCSFDASRPVEVANHATASHLYRIAQEALSNAIKHGGAKKISLSLTAQPESITLAVQNDGAPFLDPAPDIRGMGLRIIRYRAELVGGELALQNLSNGGVIVTCIVPHSAQPTP